MVMLFGRSETFVANARRHPEYFALHSFRIGGATTLAAGGDVPEVAVQREGGWRSEPQQYGGLAASIAQVGRCK